MDLLIPDTVPVNVGSLIGAFKFIVVFISVPSNKIDGVDIPPVNIPPDFFKYLLSAVCNETPSVEALPPPINTVGLKLLKFSLGGK